MIATRSLGAMIRRDINPEDIVGHAVAIAPAFDELWVVEDLPYAGGISQMASILQATEDVALGHGIAPAPFRTPAALAMEWAALERMYPGRVLGGIGHGVQTWMRELGEQVDSPLTLLRETCVAVRSLLAGDELSVDGRYVGLDSVRLEFPPSEVPIVSLGVVGPKSLELSGEVADGTILCEAHGPDQIRAAKERIAVGQTRAGAMRPHRITVLAAFHLGDPADIVRNPDAPEGWEAVSSSADIVASELLSLYDAGADSVVLVPLASDPISALDQAIGEIVPKLR